MRELENFVEQSVILFSDGILRIESLESTAFPKINSSVTCQTLEEFERRFILQTLSATSWLIGGLNGAAARLGLKRPTLLSKMRKLGISRLEQ